MKFRFLIEKSPGKGYKWVFSQIAETDEEKLLLGDDEESIDFSEWKGEGDIYDLIAEMLVVFGENLEIDKLDKRVSEISGLEEQEEEE